VMPAHLKRGQPPPEDGKAGSSQFPRSRIEPRTDGRRPPSSSFGAAAPSRFVVVPAVVGIDHSRLPALLGRFPTQVQTPTGVSVAFASFAVEKPRFRRNCLTISVLSLEPVSGCATAHTRPFCLPRRALPFRLLDLKARGIGFLLYDQQEVLAHRAQFAPRGARSRPQIGPDAPWLPPGLCVRGFASSGGVHVPDHSA
jgi:hypothetical protein